MQYKNRVKLLSMLTGILLFSGIIQNCAFGDNTNNSGDLARGAKIWANNCGRCHNYRAPTEFSANNWHLIMQHMRIQAGLTGQETRDVYAFLAAQSVSTQISTSAPQVENIPVESTGPGVQGSTINPSTYKPAATINKPQQQLQNISQTTSTQTASAAQSANSVQPAQSTKSGAAIYAQTCEACHGANGKGAIPGVPDFTTKNGILSKSNSVLLQHIINGFQTPGSPMAMPARGGNANLTNEDLQNALNYIRQKFGQ